MTTFDEIEAHAGNRDFERVNALVCIGWTQTSSAAIAPEPAAEMDISDDGSHIWCNWVASSLSSCIYEFHGNGKVINRSTNKQTDASMLQAGLDLALDVITTMTETNRDEVLNGILERLQAGGD